MSLFLGLYSNAVPGMVRSRLFSRDAGHCVYESDLVHKQAGGALVCTDATKREFWTRWVSSIDFVVTNPPFSLASSILPLAYEHARVGVAFLLRLSYLEPCRDRADWLVQHPLTKLIVLPRISFTGDRKTDSVTCGWFVWIKGDFSQRIEVVSRVGER